MGSIARMDPKLPQKYRKVSWPSRSTPRWKSFFQSERPDPPPLREKKKSDLLPYMVISRDQVSFLLITCSGRILSLQRTSAKISDFQTTPAPCPGVSEFPKPLPGRPRPDFSIFTHFPIFTHFYFCSLKQSLLPNSCFYKV